MRARMMPSHEADALLERVVLQNDLRQLTPADRVGYVRALCRSLGLNPLTQPFQYITLGGRLTLYATADCAEQLRKIHGVSIRVVSAGNEGDLYVVRVEATDKTGRTDSDMAAVSIAGLKGEALANAFMKCLTKAKRRCTMSICGLGLLEESETDTIPHAIPTRVDMDTGEVLDPPPAPTPKGNGAKLAQLTEQLAAAERAQTPEPPPGAEPEPTPAPEPDSVMERSLLISNILATRDRVRMSDGVFARLCTQAGLTPAELGTADLAALNELLRVLEKMTRPSRRPEPA